MGTENYVEYSRTGQVIKGQERAKVKSRYEEDVFPGNHSAVWGSYWEGGQWGFACCQSLIKGSYCIGADEPKQKAIEPAATTELVPGDLKTEQVDANEPAEKEKETVEEEKEEEDDENAGLSLMEIHKKKIDKEAPKTPTTPRDQLSKKELKKEADINEAMRKEEQRIKEVDAMMATDERKRKYNSMAAVTEPTEAELEAWKRKRVNTADPMAFMLNK